MLTSPRLLTSRIFLFQLLRGAYMGDMSSKTELPSKDEALAGRIGKMQVSGAGCHRDLSHKMTLPSKEDALPGRLENITVSAKHHVNGNSMVEPFPQGTQMAIFGRTGHAEVVRVVYQPENISYEKLLKIFWENHDPTQGMRQGNDVGTMYRSAIYTYTTEQMDAALKTKEDYQKKLTAKGYGNITTEIRPVDHFYYAEDYHQQYLSKNPNGYCGLGGTGVTCPIGLK